MANLGTEVPPPWLQAPLQHGLRTARGHAVLLCGPPGVGQLEMALALSKAWLCESDTIHSQALPACGACASCALFVSQTHPDLLVLLPEALRSSFGWDGGDDTGEAREAGKRKPSKEIKVDALRRVVTFAQQSSARGRAKVVVIYPAEQMNAVAANTLLKTLEEPPGLTRFILATGAPHQLLPTVRSRCQPLQLHLPSKEQGLEWLEAQGIEGADVLLDACGGQPMLVTEWASLGVKASSWNAFPETVLHARVGDVSAWPLPILINALQKLCHDMLCVSVGATPRFFSAAHLRFDPPAYALSLWGQGLSRLIRQQDHPWSSTLMTESLLIQAQRVMRTRKT